MKKLLSKDEVRKLTGDVADETYADSTTEDRDWLWATWVSEESFRTIFPREVHYIDSLKEIGWREASKPREIRGVTYRWYHVCKHPVNRGKKSKSGPMTKKELMEALGRTEIYGKDRHDLLLILDGKEIGTVSDGATAAAIAHVVEDFLRNKLVDPAELLD